MAPPTALLERERELAAIDAALARAGEGLGTVTLVEGPAGIGKTRLLSVARERAHAAGAEVLVARGSDLEREFRWGVVRQLFGAVAPDDISGSAALARTVLVPSADGEGADEGAVLHGLYWLCAGLAERGALVVCVDDAHWCDVPSLRFLAYLAHRIEGLALALVVGSRPGEVPRDAELLGRLAAQPDAMVLRPLPLSDDGAARLISAGLGVQPDARFVGACQNATQGNPFLLEELARSARDSQLTPDAAGASSVGDLGPRSVARTILRRAAVLAPGAGDLARAVAVLGPDAELRHAASLAKLDLQDAGRVADALAAAEILSDSRPLDFIHPLARAAVYGDMTTAERATLHSDAARLLGRESATFERIAVHLLNTEPSGDPATVAALREAARDAMAAAAPTAAATYLRRALAEPPDGDALTAVLHELGHAEAVDGLQDGFEEHLMRSMQISRDPEHRATVALELARAHGTKGNYERSAGIILESLAAIGDADVPAKAALEAELVAVALNDFALTTSVSETLRKLLRDLREGRVDDFELLATLALALVGSFPPASIGADVAARAQQGGTMADNSQLPGSIGDTLLYAGRLEEAHAFYVDIGADGRRRGIVAWSAFSVSFQSRTSLQLGEVRRAEEEAQLGLELLEALIEPGPQGHRFFCANLAAVLLERGEGEQVQELLERAPARPGPAATYPEAVLLGIASRLALERGDPERALDCALRSGPETLRDVNPAIRSWRSDAARALAALGRSDEARALAAEEVALARRFGVAYAVGRALRAAAHAEDDMERAAALLLEAITTVEGTAANLELMYANVELGAVLRRDGKRNAAVDRLRSGLDLATRGGATALAQRAHGELLTAGARPRRAVLSGVDALTPSERRVVDLAAQGRTNQEIAQALFVTTRTVEAHLTRAFRKLDVSSRAELGDAIASGET